MEDLKTLVDHPECCWGYIDELRMALAAVCKERDGPKKAYDAMARDLQFRTGQVRELQEENAQLRAELEQVKRELDALNANWEWRGPQKEADT